MRLAALIAIPAFAAAVLAASPALAEKPPVNTARFSNLAVGGYDPVSYFSAAGPLKGAAEFVLEHEGATWRFASQENLDAFRADPAAYAPQYGGYCAWAAAQGYTAPGDPKIWAVHGGKLYLNFNAKVQRDWDADRDGFIAAADANWPGILAK